MLYYFSKAYTPPTHANKYNVHENVTVLLSGIKDAQGNLNCF